VTGRESQSDRSDTGDRTQKGTENALHLAARLAGCTCSPEVTIEDDPLLPGMLHATIHHDDWCPLLASRRNRKD